MGAELTIEGLEDITSEIDKMLEIPSSVINSALKESAIPIYEDAKRTKAFKDKSGELRAKIKISGIHSNKNGKYVLVQDDDPTARVVEDGHAGQAPAPAHPYMRPAFEKNKEKSAEIMAERTKEALR